MTKDCEGCRFEYQDCPYGYSQSRCEDASIFKKFKKRLVNNYNQMKKDYQDGFQEGLDRGKK